MNVINQLKKQLKENNNEKINLDLASLYNQLGNVEEANKYIERVPVNLKVESI